AVSSDRAMAQTEAATKASSNSSDAKDRSSDHKLHLRLGAISIGAGYASGPAYYPYPFYTPWDYSEFWFPYWGPYPYAPGYFAYGSAKGEIKLAAEPKSAEVYLDNAYAGIADHLKNMWLDPGAYDLSVEAAGREDFHQRIYVLSGKALKITA